MVGPRRSVRVPWACLLCACVVAATSCGRRSETTSSYKDTLPPPEEPMVMDGEVGRYGGRFVVQSEAPPTTFNPLAATTVGVNELMTQLFVRLTRFDASTQDEVSALAKRWEVSEDGLTWTFELRKGARFSDGHPITADDVLFSFEAVYDPRLPSPVRALVSTAGRPWDISAPDPHTVRINTPSPIAALPALASGVSIVPRHVLGSALNEHTLGSQYGLATPPAQFVSSGAWQLKEFVPGEKTVLTRNPYWFGVDREGHRLPYLDELVFTTVPDRNTADLKFRTHEIDAIPTPATENYRWYEEHQAEGEFTLHNLGPQMNIQGLWFNLTTVGKASGGKVAGAPHVGTTKYAWFSNPVFRRAVSMAVDRDAMITSIFYGDAVKNWSTTTPADSRWFSPDLIHYDYDPAESKRLLAGLGWIDRDGDGVLEDGGGHPVAFGLIASSANAARVAMANFVRDDLAKVGIEVTVQPRDFNAVINATNVDFDYDSALSGFGLPRPDPSQSAVLWRSSGRHPWSPRQPSPATPEEARMDQLMDAVISTADVAQRKAVWKELQDYANQQAWMIWLPVELLKVPVRNRFGNLHPTAAASGASTLFWNAPQIYIKSR